jgi:broad specificity phosphatase PhoE
MKLYFTRHGESEANIRHIISNRDLPHPLTAKGREQAFALAGKLAGENISRIFTSPVPRAYETAQIVAGALSIPSQTTRGLIEYDCGILEGRGDDEAWSLHRQFFMDWIEVRNRDLCPPGGETFHDIEKRFVSFIDRLVKDYGSSDANLLLVGHGGTYIFGLPHVLDNIDFDFVQSHRIDHTIVIIAELQDGRLTCRTWGQDKL